MVLISNVVQQRCSIENVFQCLAIKDVTKKSYYIIKEVGKKRVDVSHVPSCIR